MSADVTSLHRRAVEAFGERVRAVGDDQWGLPTPCTDWDVRALVRHVVEEERWTPELMAGRTIEEVGDRFAGDLLGADPAAAWSDAAAEAVAAVDDAAMDRTVHLSFGDVPGREYALQLFADHLVHAWDLARAVGADERLPPDLVAACASWFDANEEGYRRGGVIGERAEAADDAGADPQARLLARFGRRAS